MFSTTTTPPAITPQYLEVYERWNFFNKAVTVDAVRSWSRDPCGGLHGGIEVLPN